MSSENFESLEDDFISIKDGVTTKINDLLFKSSGEKRKNLIREIQRELDDAQRLLEDLQVEAKAAPHPFRLQMNNRIKQYRQDLQNLKRKVTQNEISSASNNRNQLFARSNQLDDESTSSSALVANNRSRLLQMNETIDRTTETVYRTQQIAAETDQVGIAVVDELGTQREALIRTKERLVDTDVNLSKSRRILRSMYRRVMTNKLILVVIIILELGILAFVVWFRFFKK